MHSRRIPEARGRSSCSALQRNFSPAKQKSLPAGMGSLVFLSDDKLDGSHEPHASYVALRTDGPGRRLIARWNRLGDLADMSPRYLALR